MIAFSCIHCGLKLKVKPEFAGRSSRCPTCKQPIVVPQPDRAQGYVPAGQIDGAASSVHQAGVDGGVTLGEGVHARGDQKSVRDLLAKGKGGQRYVIESEIARGGMGAVLRAIDCDIRREVAVKFMLDESDPKKKARFVEEAQITGQLEHPNIVPIHELGVDKNKRMFFSMKMVKGRSLKEVIDHLRDNPRQAEKEYSLTRLLNILANVCHALAYAHSRGVVHRDLKPANIMLGDFGEVYVMDWGLAKVVDQESGTRSHGEPGALATGASQEAERFAQFMKDKSPGPVPPDNTGTGSSSGQSKVSTSGRDDADLTQEGSVLGTPVYMPPEQAMGEISAIDQRSDIYSVGAILYEMLTLQAPVEKEGGYMGILVRVSQGEIKRPEERTPKRFIPAELSAIAMKALAKERKDRYQTAEELRLDIERYQEGHSVSAKEDTKWEMLWKFVKRNKAFSAASLASVVVISAILAFGNYYLFNAWRTAEKANAAFESERKVRQERTRAAVPVLVSVGRQALNSDKLGEAMKHVSLALEYDAHDADALLLRAQMLVAAQDFAAARTDLEDYVSQKPKDADAAALLKLCRSPQPNDVAFQRSVADLLQKQNAFVAAGKVVNVAGKLESNQAQAVKDKQVLLAGYRQKIEAAWPGLGGKLTLDSDATFRLDLNNCKQVTSLEPLAGMPLSTLHLIYCGRLTDLTPLKGLPLTRLFIAGNYQITDLAPLRGMQLKTLQLGGPQAGGLSVADLRPLAGMPLTELHLWYCDKIEDLTPLKGLPLTWLSLAGLSRIDDLAPLQGMPLTHLNLSSCKRIEDLTPLRGAPLTELNLDECLRVTKLPPLRELKTLHLGNFTQIPDLTPLAESPLTHIDLQGNPPLKDLKPLQAVKRTLIRLNFGNRSQLQDLTPLQGLQLTELRMHNCPLIKDLTPLKGMPLTSLEMHLCPLIKDLTPLDGMKLDRISVSLPHLATGAPVLRRMKSLQTISVSHPGGVSSLPALDFWKRYDAGEFK